jgi:hypothetical protein
VAGGDLDGANPQLTGIEMESTVDKRELIRARCIRTNVEQTYLWKYAFDNEWVTMIEPGELAFEHFLRNVADITDYIRPGSRRLKTLHRTILIVHVTTPQRSTNELLSVAAAKTLASSFTSMTTASIGASWVPLKCHERHLSAASQREIEFCHIRRSIPSPVEGAS